MKPQPRSQNSDQKQNTKSQATKPDPEIKASPQINVEEIFNAHVEASQTIPIWIERGLPVHTLFEALLPKTEEIRLLGEHIYHHYMTQHMKLSVDLYTTLLDIENSKDPFPAKACRYSTIRIRRLALVQIPPHPVFDQFRISNLSQLLSSLEKDNIFYCKFVDDQEPLNSLLLNRIQVNIDEKIKILNELKQFTRLLTKEQQNFFHHLQHEIAREKPRTNASSVAEKTTEALFIKLENEFNTCQNFCAKQMSRYKFTAKQTSSKNFLASAYEQAEKPELLSLGFMKDHLQYYIEELEKPHPKSSRFLSTWISETLKVTKRLQTNVLEVERTIKALTHNLRPLSTHIKRTQLSPRKNDQGISSNLTQAIREMSAAFKEASLVCELGLGGSDFIQPHTLLPSEMKPEFYLAYLDAYCEQYHIFIEQIKQQLLTESQKPYPNAAVQISIIEGSCSVTTDTEQLLRAGMQTPKYYHLLIQAIVTNIEFYLYARNIFINQLKKCSLPSLWVSKIPEFDNYIRFSVEKLNTSMQSNIPLPAFLNFRHARVLKQFHGSVPIKLETMILPSLDPRLSDYHYFKSCLEIYFSSINEILIQIYLCSVPSKDEGKQVLELINSIWDSAAMTLLSVETQIKKQSEKKNESQAIDSILQELLLAQKRLMGLQHYLQTQTNRILKKLFIEDQGNANNYLDNKAKSLAALETPQKIVALISKYYQFLDSLENVDDDKETNSIKQILHSKTLKLLNAALSKYKTCLLSSSILTQDVLEIALNIFDKYKRYLNITYDQSNLNPRMITIISDESKKHVDAIQQKMKDISIAAQPLVTSSNSASVSKKKDRKKKHGKQDPIVEKTSLQGEPNSPTSHVETKTITENNNVNTTAQLPQALTMPENNVVPVVATAMLSPAPRQVRDSVSHITPATEPSVPTAPKRSQRQYRPKPTPTPTPSQRQVTTARPSAKLSGYKPVLNVPATQTVITPAAKPPAKQASKPRAKPAAKPTRTATLHQDTTASSFKSTTILTPEELDKRKAAGVIVLKQNETLELIQQSIQYAKQEEENRFYSQIINNGTLHNQLLLRQYQNSRRNQQGHIQSNSPETPQTNNHNPIVGYQSQEVRFKQKIITYQDGTQAIQYVAAEEHEAYENQGTHQLVAHSLQSKFYHAQTMQTTYYQGQNFNYHPQFPQFWNSGSPSFSHGIMLNYSGMQYPAYQMMPVVYQGPIHTGPFVMPNYAFLNTAPQFSSNIRTHHFQGPQIYYPYTFQASAPIQFAPQAPMPAMSFPNQNFTLMTRALVPTVLAPGALFPSPATLRAEPINKPLLFSLKPSKPPKDCYQIMPAPIIDSPETAENEAKEALRRAATVAIPYEDPKAATQIALHLWYAKKDNLVRAIIFANQSNNAELSAKAQTEFNCHMTHFIKYAYLARLNNAELLKEFEKFSSYSQGSATQTRFQP